jgi:hypothetical protein
MNRQASLMEKQLAEMQSGGAVAKESADAARVTAKAAALNAIAAEESAKAANAQIQMVRNKERARISVSVSNEEFEVGGPFSMDTKIIKISNDGLTSAFNVRAKGEIIVQPSEVLTPMYPMLPLGGVPSVIRANDEPTATEVTFLQEIDPLEMESSQERRCFHISGAVEYDDVFGEGHTTTFRYRLKIFAVRIVDTDRVRIRSFGWERYGSPEENHAT